ncbi:MAG: zinc-binding dehydrogenase [Ktedonobacterales bacterium]|nr:zinc-binding dehydrogenase [Ktedonobacterales bacterium]
MWTVYLDPHPVRVTGTRVLGLASRRAYFSPIALLRARDIGEPALPGKRWVRVRNILAGISDEDVDLIHLMPDLRASSQLAGGSRYIYLGHEVVGEVIEVGPEVEFLRARDRVTYQLDQCCATREIEPPCRHCAAGNYHLCENRGLPGPQAIGGGWGDEMIVHERQLFLVPDSLTDEQACLVEPAAMSVHTVLRHQPQPGDQVLVIGTAAVGLLVVQAARALVPNAVITALPSETFQVEMATRMGASRILYPEEGTAGVARMTGARHLQGRGGDQLIGGFDIIYDTTGTAETVQDALRWVRDGGTVVLAARRTAPMALDLSPVWRKEITLLGTIGHGTENWPRATSGQGFGSDGSRVSSFALTAALLRERRLTPEKLVTHRFPLPDVRRAITVARAAVEHRAIKVLLDIRGAPHLPQLPAPRHSTSAGR